MANHGITVVVGAAGGIGSAVARALAAEGRDLVLIDRNGDSLARLADELRAIDVRVEAHAVDLADRTAVSEMTSGLATATVDGLVLAAGVWEGTPSGEVDPDVADRIAEINYRSSAALADALVPALRRSEAPRIVAVTSVHVGLGEAGSSAYAASKAALGALVRSLAVELAPAGILVNAVAPGFVDTAMARLPDGTSEHDTDRFRAVYLRGGRLPIGRVARPDEIATPILFLLSPTTTYITGTTLVVDGGLTVAL